METLNEVSRKNLVGKTKVQSPARYNKRLRYATMSIPEIDEDKFLNDDMLVISVRVGAYVDTLAYEGVMRRIIDLVAKSPKHKLNRRVVIQAMNEQVDLTDVYVKCTCPDWRMRYAYWATKYDYIYGAPENRPADITNPFDKIGSSCKHLACILANKKWLVKASSVVNDYIHNHFEEVLHKYNINEEQFMIDDVRYAAAVKQAVRQEHKRLPAELVGFVNKLYVPTEISDILNNSLSRRGWHLRIDTDLNQPVAVYLSKNEEAIESPEEFPDDVYAFDVIPAGSKVRLKWINRP